MCMRAERVVDQGGRLGTEREVDNLIPLVCGIYVLGGWEFDGHSVIKLELDYDGKAAEPNIQERTLIPPRYITRVLSRYYE